MTLKIVISGWTAAGKSTHGRLLAEGLGLPYVSATEILAGLVAERTGRERESRWQPSLDNARSLDETIDDELDALLTEMFEHQDGVFDACLLPWVSPALPAVRVWIESDLPSRERKCFVSHLGEGVGWDEAKSRVAGKDAFTQSRLEKTSGCAYHPGTALFDVIANNETLIPEPTRDSATSGIAAFQPVLLEAVAYAAGLRFDVKPSPWLRFPRIDTY